MAQAQYGTLITAIGLAQIANAQVTQSKVGLEYIALGDGNGAHYVPTQNQTTLVNEVWRGPISELSIDPTNDNRIIVDAVIPVTAGGFTIREIGIFDDKDQLIAIGQYPEKYKPQLSEGVSEETIIHFVIETNNADAVKLTIDPTVIIASRPYVDEKVAQVQTALTKHLADNEMHVTTAKQDKWDKVDVKADFIAVDKSGVGGYPDPNTFLDSIFITNHANAQSVGSIDNFWYIEQLFYNATGVENSRSQIARSYIGDNADLKIRHFYNGEWSPWSPSLNSFITSTLHAPVNAVLEVGWENMSGGYLTFYKDGFGIIHIQGRVGTTSVTTGYSLITILPVGYRPIVKVESQVAAGVTDSSYIEILPDGRVLAWNDVVGWTNVLIDTSYRTT